MNRQNKLRVRHAYFKKALPPVHINFQGYLRCSQVNLIFFGVCFCPPKACSSPNNDQEPDMSDRYIKKLIEKSQKQFALEKYRNVDIAKTHRQFEGTPKKHPHDDALMILLLDPFSKKRDFYEFTVDSIGHIEEIGTITNEEGESALKVRIWIKKGTPAIKAKPFIVR